MKYALIGCGRIAVNHIKAVVENDIDMVAACDIKLEKIDQLIEKTNYNKDFKKYTDYKKMVDENPDLDFVSIATESGIHAEIALYCIEKGINVIIDEDNEITIDFHIIVSYGVNIATIADNIISNVKYKVEEFTGMSVKKVNVYVEGVRNID